MGSRSNQLKVLQIVESLDNQATEAWLRRAHRAMLESGADQRWTFFSTNGPGRHDDEVRELGGEVITATKVGESTRFLAQLRAVIASGGFDVIDAHHDVMSALYLWASRGVRISRRIVHVHNTSLALPTPNPMKALVAGEAMRRFCLIAANNVVGVSRPALDAFLRGREPKPSRDRVIHCGIDTSRFTPQPARRATIRVEHGVDDNVLVILFAGRLIEYKNPLFVIDVLESVIRSGARAVAMIAGTGPLAEELSRRADAKGLSAAVRMLGWQQDIASIMDASDVMLVPSAENPVEGLGLNVVEAQAAGLPVVMSYGIPPEAIVVPEITRRLRLADGADVWAKTVTALCNGDLPRRESSAGAVTDSSYSMHRSLDALLSLYDSARA